jgi:hypothetical protein
MTLEFIDRFSKNNNTALNFTKIRQVGAEMLCGTDGQTDRHGEANSRSSQFCERTFHPIHFSRIILTDLQETDDKQQGDQTVLFCNIKRLFLAPIFIDKHAAHVH